MRRMSDRMTLGANVALFLRHMWTIKAGKLRENAQNGVRSEWDDVRDCWARKMRTGDRQD